LTQAPLHQLRAEAAGLASQLGSLSTHARAASAAQVGSAGRRRSGMGENFWQYRRFVPEDGAQRVDWRRSAREEHLFVRETELETARTFLFWVDPSPGFAWSGDEAHLAKADRALVLSMALAGSLSRAGERCGALGGARSPVSGARAAQRVGEDLRALDPKAPFPRPPREAAAAVIASDFYSSLEDWRRQLTPIAAKCRDGTLLQVCDPVEITYPFEGRTRFFRPGDDQGRIVGKAESLRDAYLERFERRRSDLAHLAAELGWRFITHVTNLEARTALGDLARGFEMQGSRT
jgi:uncharacterized protein (DUF58 family)